MPVAREGQAGYGLVRGFVRGAQAGGQCALACAVDPLDDDEHAASVARGAEWSPHCRERSLPLEISAFCRAVRNVRRMATSASACCGHKPNLLWRSLR